LQIKHIEYVDQNPIGRSSRSNWFTYIKALSELYAKENHQKGYSQAFFFNVDGGRETCVRGSTNVEMVYGRCAIPCETL
jgi:excinuclease ABC subunit A